MPFCPRCSTNYAEGTDVCWPCHVRLVAGSIDEAPPDASAGSTSAGPTWTHLQAAYLAPDEFSAIRIEGLLQEAGINATIESAQIPWVDGIMSNIKGYWGRVLVHPEDHELAAELVASYLEQIEDEDR